MTVYVVTNDCCGDCGRVRGVFATELAADAFAARHPGHYVEPWEVTE